VTPAALAERTPGRRSGVPAAPSRHREQEPLAVGDGGVGGEASLEEVLARAWEGLAAHAAVACPLCGGAMTPRYAAGPTPVGGRCADCGTTLA
jgi:hypothetical protein